MNNIYVTGDTHCPIDIRKLGAGKWKESRNLTKSDYLIILGDFGVLWKYEPNKEEIYWTKWLTSRKFTTLFIQGNHENFIRLYDLPQVEMFGGTVGKVSDSIYHLRNGQVYTIYGKTFFCMGGADSYDRKFRTEGVSWWPEEQPSNADLDYALCNLEKYNNKVDYILTHTAPRKIAYELIQSYGVNPYYEKKDPLWVFLQHIYDSIEFSGWCLGHWHENKVIDKCNLLYEDIKKVI